MHPSSAVTKFCKRYTQTDTDWLFNRSRLKVVTPIGGGVTTLFHDSDLMIHSHWSRDLAGRHWHRKHSVSMFCQFKECNIVPQRIEDGVDPRFHHLFLAHGVISLVLIKVAL